MDKKRILDIVDHTLLKQTASWEEIRNICDDAVTYAVASVCIPPSYVKPCREYLGEEMRICTVIGFPNGYSTTATKVFEAQDAIKNGADEIDMVVNLGWVKDGRETEITDEIRQIKQVCKDKVLKVIIETCLLTEEEKMHLCWIVTAAGADFIKTSTGFSTGGATIGDVQLMRDNVGKSVKVKAAGGISTLEDAEQMMEAGAERLGTSRIVKLMKNENKGENNY